LGRFQALMFYTLSMILEQFLKLFFILFLSIHYQSVFINWSFILFQWLIKAFWNHVFNLPNSFESLWYIIGVISSIDVLYSFNDIRTFSKLDFFLFLSLHYQSVFINRSFILFQWFIKAFWNHVFNLLDTLLELFQDSIFSNSSIAS
jgi:hypothetical protein